MPNVPDVYMRIYYDVAALRADNPNTYRDYNYRIIDESNFERTTLIK